MADERRIGGIDGRPAADEDDAARKTREHVLRPADIYVAEVANTYWPILFSTKPNHELRSLQKLVRIGAPITSCGAHAFFVAAGHLY